MSSFKLRKEKNCLNCGHEVEKHFCPVCGQENIEVKEDALHMVIHAIADYFHFEHKFFGTIKPLLLKPGKLTAAYVAGKRVTYIHPIRLYIFISIVFFLFVLSSKKAVDYKDEEGPAKKGQELSQKQKKKLIDTQVKALEAGLKYTPMSQQKKDSIIRITKANITAEVNGKNYKTEKKGAINFGYMNPSDTTVEAYDKRQLTLPKEKRDGFIKHYFKRRSIEVNRHPNPREKFIEGFLHNIPKMMFILLPLFALILKLVYINKQRYYYEHLIYSFHVHSAIFLAILFNMLLQWVSGFVYDVSGWISFLCLIYIIWYIYRSLRTFYGSSRWITILKVSFLFFCYVIVATLSFLVGIAFSFAML